MRANTFECNKTKARSNFKKHQISFAESCRIFDGHVLTVPSKQNCDSEEERFITIGAIDSATAALVVWTRRKNNVRVISARKASRKEREQYHAYIEKKIN